MVHLQDYYIVDAFTSEPFGGNPAGVVLLGKDSPFPNNALMLHIAAELRYSETAFVQQNGANEFTVRYFTPRSEVDLCGHATIATFGVLRQTGIIADGAVCLNHTLAGDLAVRIGQQVMMQMATPKLIDTPVDAERLHRIMAAEAPFVWPQHPIQIVSTGLPDIILPVADLSTLNALAPDMEALTALSQELGVVGVHAFALSDDGFKAHVRNFAPLYGVPEESATGTANAALTFYLFKQGIIPESAQCRFLQGEAMRRPSVVDTTLHNGAEIFVGGESFILAKGSFNITLT